MPFPITDSRALHLIRSMVYEDLSVLVPKVAQDIHYPRVEETLHITKEEAKELLQNLCKHGYLLKRFYGKVYRCPYDGTVNIRPRLLCPQCQSEDIESIPLIEHLTCGHVDIEKNFLKEGEYICPKDGKKLHQIGVDYRKPGTAYHCLNCGGINPAPLERWTCNTSNHSFSIEEAVAEKTFSYTLNEGKRDELLHIFEFIQPIVDTFKRFGFKTEAFCCIKGMSGVSHLVDICAFKETERPLCVVEILFEEDTKPEEVLKLYATSLDLNAKKSLLIAIPNLDKESGFYADKLRLNVIEAKDFKSIDQRLDSILKEWTA